MSDGSELTAYSRSVPFSFWPTAPGTPRASVQSLLFAIDPWVIMRHAIGAKMATSNSKSEAIAYIEQAKDFYDSAQASSIGAAKPLQLYYSYLNIAKAFIIFRNLLLQTFGTASARECHQVGKSSKTATSSFLIS
jgi:hypothetical protein